MAYLYGPCTITVGTVEYGTTWGGITINVKEHERVIPLINKDVKRINVPLYGDGVIHHAEIKPIYITDSTAGQKDLVLVENSIITFTNKDYVLTLYYATILFPKSLQIGVPRQSPFDLRLFFKKDPTTGDFFKFQVL